MPDRPAAELHKEWEAFPLPHVDDETPRCLWFAVLHLGNTLQRLARAEQALADVEKVLDTKALRWSVGGTNAAAPSFVWKDDVRAALRASQGGQT